MLTGSSIILLEIGQMYSGRFSSEYSSDPHLSLGHLQIIVGY